MENNHHHRIIPYELSLPWTVPMGYEAESSLAPLNLLGSTRRLELSHHLAHAWSTAGTAPWDPCCNAGEATLVVVMDGMGDTLHSMRRAQVRGHPGLSSLPPSTLCTLPTLCPAVGLASYSMASHRGASSHFTPAGDH